jgi:mono/diheme cytochrome c family protein
MPAFVAFDPGDIDAVVDYVMFLAMRGELEMLLAHQAAEEEEIDEDVVADELEFVVDRWGGAGKALVNPAPPIKMDLELARRGRDLFRSESGGCVKCHGDDAKGHGADSDKMVDDWGNKLRPRDLTSGVLRGGRRTVDLFWRVACGVKGTPMPGLLRSASTEDIWALAYYVQTLGIAEQEE